MKRQPVANEGGPSWLSACGEDAWGYFADLIIKGVTQRVRWIPRGQFQMGSPEDEPGHFDREGSRHTVTIPRGFWLFDTPVTQELWEAVMGGNPAEFKSQHRPVERVSWDDCQNFFENLKYLIPEIEFGLPTEAEWEYACRAGTTAATYAGSMDLLGANNAPSLDAIAWYAGNCGVGWDLQDGCDLSERIERQHEFAKGGTRPVATRDPNPWGLYDTLGNVWEWCHDTQRTYEDEPAEDPIGPEIKTNKHSPLDGLVVRGGSWFSFARLVRAAYRGECSRAFRLNFIGLRCRVLPNKSQQDAWHRQVKAIPEIQRVNGIAKTVRVGSDWLRSIVGNEIMLGFDHLVHVNLVDSQVTDFELLHLQKLAKLESLNLGNTQVTDDGLKKLCDKRKNDAGQEVYFEGLPKLESLNLGNTQVTDDGLEHLKELKTLVSLVLGNTKVTDDGLKTLRDTKKNVFGQELHFEGLPKLESLNLSNTQVTDAGLEHLQELKTLQWLDVENTQVTNKGLVSLQTALPNCVIDTVAGAAADND
jgi:formylglycine-generating enzyme required for sulfatase activity